MDSSGRNAASALTQKLGESSSSHERPYITSEPLCCGQFLTTPVLLAGKLYSTVLTSIEEQPNQVRHQSQLKTLYHNSSASERVIVQGWSHWWTGVRDTCCTDHHLPEIKRRALDSLCFKLSNKLLSPSDFRVRVVTACNGARACLAPLCRSPLTTCTPCRMLHAPGPW